MSICVVQTIRPFSCKEANRKLFEKLVLNSNLELFNVFMDTEFLNLLFLPGSFLTQVLLKNLEWLLLISYFFNLVSMKNR